MDASTTVRRRDAAASTARLLAAATEEFAAHGYEGARVDRISASSGLNRALLFHRFGDKEGLYRAVLAQVAQDAAATRSAITADRSAPGDRVEFVGMVRELVRATADFLLGHPDAARILAWERAAGWAAFHAARPESDDPAAEQITEWFRQGAERGWLREGPSPDRQLALVLELVTAVLSEGPEFVKDAVTAALMREEKTR
ncbi:helix-turn-helix domain-containing protein [Leifsonia shinshuensis]|uniref:TetR/AcrR family transcriptional regulator n=1 Tax=Leifsonia TaxID=110932 RepID=UPI0028558915|nr:helix-turn-helix domain-containing protein [Leifsonia shinshuensis]MDR6970564.1 AcrR family transcriptional regulator [Leifsonia shinshuensis]